MTALPLCDFSDAERDRLAAIEAAPAADESARERVSDALLRAILGDTDGGLVLDGDLPAAEIARLIVEQAADAAITVLSGPSSDAEQAVERVLALATELETRAWGAPPEIAGPRRIAAQRIRHAVAGD